MRPLELTLEGFTAFRQAQTLSFQDLDLFAITGPTGAGKSSLLDALTFALYGSTMRGARLDEIVSQGASELKVQLTFAVRGALAHDADRDTYRITRAWRRRAKTVDSKAQLERREPDGSWVQLENKERAVVQYVEQLLGMPYETFTRVIVLPQGRFDEFLKGDAPKRRELLRMLAGHEVFERMRKEAADRAKGWKARREEMAIRLSSLEVPEASAIQAREAQLATRQATVPGLTTAVERAAAALDDAGQLLANLERLAARQRELGELENEAGAIAELAGRLERARVADRLAGSHALWQDATRQAASTAEGFALATQRQAAAAAAQQLAAGHHATAQERHTTLLDQWAVRERIVADAHALADQVAHFAKEVAGANTAHAAAEAKLARAATEHQAAVTAGTTATGALASAEATLAAHAPDGGRLAELDALVPELAAWKALEARRIEAAARAARAQADAVAAGATVARETTRVDQAEAALVAATTAWEAAKAARADAERAGHARAVRAGLHQGDDCPVCSATYPGPAGLPDLPGGPLPDVGPSEAARTAADRAARDARAALARADGLGAAAATAHATTAAALQEIVDALELATHALDDMLGNPDWQPDALETEHAALTAAARRHQEASSLRQEAAFAARAAEATLGFAARTLAEATEARAATAAEREARAARHDEATRKLGGLTGGQPLAELANKLAAERKVQTALLEKARTALAEADAERARATEGEANALAARDDAATRLADATAGWQGALAANGLDEPAYDAAKAAPAEQAGWAKRIATHGEALEGARARVAELVTVVGGRTIARDAVARLTAERDAARDGLQAATDANTTDRIWLETARADVAQAGRLAADRDDYAQHEQTYHTLATDLAPGAFQAYMLEHLQHELLARATVLLRELTEGRYALVLQDGEFCVEDTWNGGEVRRVRTLSGGETFAASLALALALSERLAMGTELGSLFLDEGFGALDAETLESVCQVLESLRQQHRLIGVITHVAQLGERLPTQVRVTKSPHGSRLAIEVL